MVKFITKTICVALVAMLCVGSANAQNQKVRSVTPKQNQAEFMSYKAVASSHSNFIVPAPKGMVNVTLAAGDVWGDGTGYQMLLDADATAFGTIIPTTGALTTSGNSTQAVYDQFEYKIPVDADWILTTTHIVINNSITIQIPAGTYDYCITNPTPGDRMWIAGGDNGRKDNYVFEDGKKYTFTAAISGTNDAITILIEDAEPENPCPAVTNLTATLTMGAQVKLTWTAPAKALTGYKVYDGTALLATVTETTFTTGNLTAGSHTLGVEAIYDDGCDPVKVTTTITIKLTTPPTNVNAVYAAGCAKATITWNAPTKERDDVIFNNGPLVTHQGQGAGGNDASDINFDSSLYGMRLNQVNSDAITDDFTLTTPSTIESVDFFVYQTSAPSSSSPITGVYVQIFDGPPNAGGTVVFGDLTTNRMEATSFSNCYRVSSGDDGNLLGTARAIMLVNAAVGYDFAAGTYWIVATFTGSTSFTGPWAPPVTIWDVATTGNGMLNSGGAGWTNWTDGTTGVSYAFPFILHGEGGEPPVPQFDVYRDGVKITATPVEATTYDDTTFDPETPHTWCVVAVLDDAHSNAVCKEMPACQAEPCNPVTGATVTFNANNSEATITWTAPAGTGLKYTVKRGATTICDKITATTCTEVFNFVSGTEYTWTITTVCTSGESTLVTVNGTPMVGINELENSIRIFPNPAATSVTIQGANIEKVEIYNTVGQLMEVKTGDVSSVDVSAFATGIYFFKVYDNKSNVTTKRIMVAR